MELICAKMPRKELPANLQIAHKWNIMYPVCLSVKRKGFNLQCSIKHIYLGHF